MASTMLHEKCCNTVLQIGAPVEPLCARITGGVNREVSEGKADV